MSELRTQNENLEQSNKETLGRVIELEQQLGEARVLVERHGNELKVHQDAKQQLGGTGKSHANELVKCNGDKNLGRFQESCLFPWSKGRGEP